MISPQSPEVEVEVEVEEEPLKNNDCIVVRTLVGSVMARSSFIGGGPDNIFSSSSPRNDGQCQGRARLQSLYTGAANP